MDPAVHAVSSEGLFEGLFEVDSVSADVVVVVDCGIEEGAAVVVGVEAEGIEREGGGAGKDGVEPWTRLTGRRSSSTLLPRNNIWLKGGPRTARNESPSYPRS